MVLSPFVLQYGGKVLFSKFSFSPLYSVNVVVLIIRDRFLCYSLSPIFILPSSLLIPLKNFILKNSIFWYTVPWVLENSEFCVHYHSWDTENFHHPRSSLMFSFTDNPSPSPNIWVVVTQEGYTGILQNKLKLQYTGKFFSSGKQASALLLRLFNCLTYIHSHCLRIISLT